MLTEFELLIQQLESEISALSEELQECLQIQDYKYAQYYQKGIWRIERKIERLKQLNRNPTKPDTQHLVDAIIELDKGMIQSFSLFFLKKSDFYLHFFRISDESLYCQIPSENEMSKAYYYRYFSRDRKSILSLGFDIGKEKPGIKFSIERDQACNEILAKLSVLMFDILHINTQSSGYITKRQIS